MTFLCENRVVWDNVGKHCRPQMTVWRMRIACCITKATNTASEYVILIAFPLQQWLKERASMLRYACTAACHVTYVAVSVMLIVVLMLQHERNASFPIGRYQITPIFGYVTLTADQNDFHRSLPTIIRISNTICCPSFPATQSSHSTICCNSSSLACRFRRQPVSFTCLTGPEVRWPRRPDLCPKLCTTHEGVMFAVGGRKREGNS
jgi:hypothetical protein